MSSHETIARAEALAQQGQGAAAEALLAQAAERGDAQAAFELAIWKLVGAPIARDVPAARALLMRGMAQGHADALIMGTALMANGSGGPVAWAEALALLRKGAATVPAAAEQIALIDAMALSADGYPAAPIKAEKICTGPDVWLARGLLTPAECAHVARAAIDLLEPASVVDPATGRAIPHPIRTSAGAVIGPTREDLVIGAINRRLAAWSQTQVAQGEPLAVLHYAPGQQYRPHLDALPHTANQRTHTVLIYLNQGYAGGGTQFLENGMTVAGKLGDAILFRNVLADGAPDPRSRHAGLPVQTGTKWLATRWIRAHAHDVWSGQG